MENEIYIHQRCHFHYYHDNDIICKNGDITAWEVQFVFIFYLKFSDLMTGEIYHHYFFLQSFFSPPLVFWRVCDILISGSF